MSVCGRRREASGCDNGTRRRRGGVGGCWSASHELGTKEVESPGNDSTRVVGYLFFPIRSQ